MAASFSRIFLHWEVVLKRTRVLCCCWWWWHFDFYFFLDIFPLPFPFGFGVGTSKLGSDLTSDFVESSFLRVWYCVPPGWIFPWIALCSLSWPMPYFLIKAAWDIPFSNSTRQAWLIKFSSPRVCKACIAA